MVKILKIGVFTIASKNYLAYVRTLMASVKKHFPEYHRYLCLADEVAGYFDPSREEFEVVQANQIGIDTYHDMTVRYDIMEFNTAVKPFMIEWLLKNTDLDVVIYLDPDIQVFSRFEALESEIQKGASVVLTPHITQPVEDGLNPNDHHMLQAGVFNLGFIAVRRCDEAIRFVQWWGSRLKTLCASDISNNLFTDQRWCDLAPCFLDQLKVFKDPGYNIAYWNLAQRKITRGESGDWLADGRPLVFFHFSGVSADQRKLVSKHQNRFGWEDIESCQPLFEAYLDALVASGWSVCKQWPYAYSQVSASLKITSMMRQLYREKNPEPISLDVRDTAQYLIELCNRSTPNIPIEDGVAITELMILVYRLRPDLQAAFSLATEEGRRGFAHWFEISAEREYGLPKEVIRQSMILGDKQPIALKKIAGMGILLMSIFRRYAVKLGTYLSQAGREKCKSTWRKMEARLCRWL